MLANACLEGARSVPVEHESCGFVNAQQTVDELIDPTQRGLEGRASSLGSFGR